MDQKSEENSAYYASDEDIFDNEDGELFSKCESPSSIRQRDADKAKLIRAKKLLAGVPLPPKFTNPQVNLDAAVSLLKKHLAEYNAAKNGSSSGVENMSLDIYLNRNDYIQELENVRILVQDWFNSNETSSFMTCTVKQLTASAKKKQKKNGWSESPASRTKYLNRRNTVYKTLCPSSLSQRTLTLDRKGGLLKSKSDSKFNTKSAGPKRALFQSPDKQITSASTAATVGVASSQPPLDFSVPSTSSASSCSTVSGLRTPTRSLTRRWVSREEVRRSSSSGRLSSEKKKCWRNLKLDEGGEKVKDQETTPSTAKLSKLHARKLLWAIDQVLKGEGVTRSDPEFRQLAKCLFKETSAVWLKEYGGQKKVGSTSNAMFEVAKTLLSKVEQQMGIAVQSIRDRHPSVFEAVANSRSPEDSSMLGTSFFEESHITNLSNTQPIYSISSESVDSKLTSEILGPGSSSESSVTCDINKSLNRNIFSSNPSVLCDEHSQTPCRLVNENNDDDISDINPTINKTDLSTDIMKNSEPLINKSSRKATPSNRKKVKRKRCDEAVTEISSINHASVKKLCLEEECSDSNNDASTVDNVNIEKDKENDSGVENTSEQETQNWSPVIRLKRTSRDKWTSELKKKCLNRKPDQSPNGSPFLEIEGPFKYRLCERALTGDYITVILKGTSYLESYNKLIRNKGVTEDSILVRPLTEGLELGIPVILLEQEKVVLGPHTVCDMVGDIIEDAIFRMDEIDYQPSEGFPGFSISDVYASSLNTFRMSKSMKINDATGNPVPKPLFTMYKYAIITKSPPDGEQFYKIFVEIPKSSMFLMSRKVDGETILVRPLKSNSPKKITLELNVPVRLVSADFKPISISVLEDFKNTNNLLTLQT